MFQAILFDLDGTLLDIDVDGFLKEYFAALGPVLAAVTGDPGGAERALGAVMRSTNEMCGAHPGVVNREVFNESFFGLTGADLECEEAARHIDRFYAEQFPLLQGTHGPRSGGADAVDAARACGLPIALATNPIFPLAAVVERLRWAGLHAELFDVITSYENMHACKPLPEYFIQTAEMLGVEPHDCLMVGDDPGLDLAAADVGMRTFHVGDGADGSADWHGDLVALKHLIERHCG